MKIKELKIIVSALIFTIFWSGQSLADSNLEEAISHTKTAIELGKQRYDKEFLLHAKTALKAAIASYRNATGSFSSSKADAKARDNEHTKQAISHLKEAVNDEKGFHIQGAVHHAEEALSHLESAPKSN